MCCRARAYLASKPILLINRVPPPRHRAHKDITMKQLSPERVPTAMVEQHTVPFTVEAR